MTDSNIINVLKKCMEEHKIVSLYFDKSDNQVHLTGYIHYLCEEELVVAHISKRGEYDGYILKKVEELYRIDCDGEYERKIEKLYTMKRQFHPDFSVSEKGALLSLLDFAYTQKLIISAYLENETITGIVKTYDGGLWIEQVTELGRIDGETIIDVDEVHTFVCDSDYEQDINILRD